MARSNYLGDLMKDERPFNMAERFLFRLDNRLNECNVSAMEGDLIGWYRGLKTVYRMISFKIAEEKDNKQRDEVLTLFEEAKKKLQPLAADFGRDQVTNQIHNYSITHAEIILDKLEAKLISLMYKYKMIFPDLYDKKKDKNVTKFIEMYLKKSVIKKAIESPEYLEK